MNVCFEDNMLCEIILKLEKVFCWMSKYDVFWSFEFLELVNELLVDVCEEISCLVEGEDFSIVDIIVKMILWLRSVWGSKLFEFLKIKLFLCERIEMKSVVVFVG